MTDIPKNDIPTILVPSVDMTQRERGTYEEDKELKALYEYYFESQKKKANTYRDYKVIEKGTDPNGWEVTLEKCDFIKKDSGEVAITSWMVRINDKIVVDTILENRARIVFRSFDCASL